MKAPCLVVAHLRKVETYANLACGFAAGAAEPTAGPGSHDEAVHASVPTAWACLPGTKGRCQAPHAAP